MNMFGAQEYSTKAALLYEFVVAIGRDVRYYCCEFTLGILKSKVVSSKSDSRKQFDAWLH